MKGQEIPTYQGVPLRRSLFALTPAERKRYFWCLKAIGFLPAHSTTREYFYRGASKGATVEQKIVKPQTIQDELVGSHATVCEHQTIYFAHYHRHLTAVFEMELNYAQEFLLGQHKGNDFYLAHKAKFDVVIEQYTNLYNLNPEVKSTKNMAHYWNPTHYLHDADIVPPVELLDPVFAKAFLPKYYWTYEIQPIDLLYQQANHAYPWEFNFQQKWFKERNFQALRPQFKKNLTEVNPTDQTNTYFSSNPSINYSPNTSQIINGKLNPRGEDSQLTDFFEGFLGKDSSTTVEAFKLFYQVSTASKVRGAYYFENGFADGQTQNQVPLATNKMRTWNCHPSQTLSQFGALSKNLQWISQKEISYYHYSDENKIKAQIYNNNLPHYQIAYAYFSKEVNKDFLTFLTDDANDQTKVYFESSHDCIHDFNQYFMRDGSFSLCNLLFFPYHSYIDLALELKIRQVALSEYQKTKQLLSQYHDRQQIFEYLLYPNQEKVTKGDYMVMEWANPSLGMLRGQTYDTDPDLGFTLNDVEYIFDFYTYCLSEPTQSIRRSYQFKDLYNTAFKQEDKNIEKYKSFNGFQDYNFDYNYEMFEYDVTQDEVTGAVSIVYSDSDKTKPKIIKTTLTDQKYYPKHLEIIRADVLSRQTTIEKAIVLAKKRNTSNLKKEAHPLQQRILSNEHQITRFYEIKGISEDSYASLLNQPFFIVGRYPSSLSSGIYKLSIVAGNSYRPEIFEGTNFDKTISKKLKSGLDLTSLNIFSRDGTQSNCSRCKQYKYFSIDINAKLQSSCPELWKIFTSYQNSNTPLRYSDSSESHPSNNTLKDWFNVIMPPAFDKLRLVEGAEQIQIFSRFDGPHDISGSIKVDATIFSVFSGEMKSLVSHSDDTLNTKFNFDRVVLFSGSSSIPGDKAIYKELRIRIALKTKVLPGSPVPKTKLLSFNIKGYFKAIRYDLKITAKQVKGQLIASVDIFDKDYGLRHEYVNAFAELAQQTK